jgi:hypothetical protein
MKEALNIIKCAACPSSFPYGPNNYRGRYLPRYKITVCDNCYKSNHDGWAPHLEDKITAKLRELGEPIPARNLEGWLPRD